MYANELEIIDGKLTGKHLEILLTEKESRITEILAQVEKIELDQVIAVGDGANDLPMLNIAGLEQFSMQSQKKKKRKR